MSERIVFLVDDLEPRTGPGDADRLYASECVRRGHSCCLVALHDRHVPAVRQNESVDRIRMLRLPKTLAWAARMRALSIFIEDFSPTILSLRFINYAYQEKGIVWQLGSFLAPLFSGCKTNIKMDELWIGEYCQASVKDKLIGAAQKYFILRFLELLRPDVIHTNSFPHVAVLKHHGFDAKYLPLIGNIPITNENADSWLLPWLENNGISNSVLTRGDYWLFGFFGSIHLRQVSPSLPSTIGCLKVLQEISRVHRKKIILLSIGNSRGIPNNYGESEWREQTKRLTPPIPFFTLGTKPAVEVSQFLNSLDFGLTTHPYVQVEKSGTVAAMLEHGLPVIATRDDIRLPYENAMPRLDPTSVLIAGPELVQALGKIARGLAKPRLAECVSQFLADMSF